MINTSPLFEKYDRQPAEEHVRQPPHRRDSYGNLRQERTRNSIERQDIKPDFAIFRSHGLLHISYIVSITISYKIRTNYSIYQCIVSLH